jgi:hypothetical protein
MRAVELSVNKQTKIRAAWAGQMTCAQVAARFAVSEYMVRQVWEIARVAGLIPDGPRPRFVAASVPPVEVDYAAPVSDAEIVEDEREAIVSHDANVCGSAALLTALRKHHPKQAKAHDVPYQWLAGELRRMPTPEELRRMRLHNFRSY